MGRIIIFSLFLALYAGSLWAPPSPIGVRPRLNNNPPIPSLPQGASGIRRNLANDRQTTPGVAPTVQQEFFQPSGNYYNQLKTPQFVTEILGGADEKAFNGGLGDGFANSFFCGPADEEMAYLDLRDGSNFNQSPSADASNKGSYQFLRLVDRCRTEGCGPLRPDGKYFVLGIPKYATNCHPWGQMAVRQRSGWDPTRETRNFIPNRGFRYGRYLMKYLSRNLGTATSNPRENIQINSDMDIHFLTDLPNHYYSATTVEPYFADFPQTPLHLQWGFTCAAISRANGYRLIPGVSNLPSGSGQPREFEDERSSFYKTLLETAKNLLGSKIALGRFGILNTTTPNTDQRAMREIVVNIYSILNRMIPLIVAPENRSSGLFGMADILSSISRNVERALNPQEPIRLMSCPVVRGSLVEYQHVQNRICLFPDVANDCQSKRVWNSHPHFNVGNSCVPSYGELDEENGLHAWWFEDPGYELDVQNYEVETARYGGTGSGVVYDWTPVQGWRARRASPFRPSGGYAPVIVSLMAHQLVHAYFQRELGQDRMLSWPSPESVWEERLAVMAQALVMNGLCEAGYCPHSFGMSEMEYISVHRDMSVPASRGGWYNIVTDIDTANHYYYPNQCRGFNKVFLGPFCTNMFNIASLLERLDVDTAGMMALFHAKAPLLDPPPMMTIDGTEQPFSLPGLPTARAESRPSTRAESHPQQIRSDDEEDSEEDPCANVRNTSSNPYARRDCERNRDGGGK